MYKWIDLHCHLEGGIPENALNKIRQNNGKPAFQKRDLNWLQDFSKYFWEISRSLQKESDFEIATREFLISQHNAWVAYCEFRVAPYHHVTLWWKNFSKILLHVKKWIDQAYSDCWIIWKIIIESARQYGKDMVEYVFNWTLKCYGDDYVVWFGIWWVESDWDFKNFDNTLLMCEKYGIPVSLHAWENWSVSNLLYALKNPIVKRIWHALSFWDISEQDKLKYNNKLIEICLSSNEYISKNFSHKAIKQMFEYKFPVAISTDDSMIFDTDFQKESNKLWNLLDLNDYEIDNINRNAISFAFCNDNVKQKILEILS